MREAVAQSLEMLGDTTAIPALIKLLDGGVSQAVQVQNRPHLSQPYEAVLEALGTMGATGFISLIQPFLEAPCSPITMCSSESYVPIDAR